jgi:hypothetical protein
MVEGIVAFPRFGDRTPLSGFSHGLSGDDPLGPAEADLIEVQVSIPGADLMIDAGDGPTDPITEVVPCDRTVW